MDNYTLFSLKNKLEEVLSKTFSICYIYQIRTETIEKRIAKSKYIHELQSGDYLKFYIDDIQDIFVSIFPELELSNHTNEYKECSWCAYVYAYLFFKYHLTLEAIFIYFPLEELYKCFAPYHEMDISQIEEIFIKRKEDTNIISTKMKELNLTNKIVSEYTGISISNIDSFRNNRRDINKLEAIKYKKLIDILRLDYGTLLQTAFDFDIPLIEGKDRINKRIWNSVKKTFDIISKNN